MTYKTRASIPAFAAALSTDRDLDTALDDVAGQGLDRLGAQPDLAFVFVSADRVQRADFIADSLTRLLGTDCLVGCAAESVIGNGTEVEGSPALAIWLASLPETIVSTMHLTFERTSDGNGILGWPDDLIDCWPADATLIRLVFRQRSCCNR